MNLKKKSIKVLKSLQLKNGGILATPLDGGYPYIYTRDGVIITKAFNSVGLVENSERFYYFMKKFTKIEDYQEVFQRYNEEGYPCVTRKEENDNEGLLLHGIYDTYAKGKNETFLQNMWPLIEQTANLILSYSKTGLVKTENSIHEFYPLENGFEIWANCAGWRGLKDAAEIATLFNQNKQAKAWLNRAEIIEKNIRGKMFNKRLNVFVKNTKFQKTPDMSQLAPFYFGMVDSKTLLRNSMNFLAKHLKDKNLGGFRRFRKFEICKNWHWYTGGNGTWCALTCWAAKFYNKLGMRKESDKALSWIEEVASKSKGLLPEHIATKQEYDDWKAHEIEFNKRILNATKKAEKSLQDFKGEKVVYWANPLGWSHAEYILLKE
jgi:GH15 family glucan-1,4-alpha-glucosidase